MLAAIGLAACAAATRVSPSELPAIEDEGGAVSTREAVRTVSELAEEAPNADAVITLLSTIEELSHAPLYRDSHVELLIDGPATYDAMLQAIETAQSHVHLETYIFADDRVGQQFAEALTERAQAGIDVRIIYDSFGSRASETDFFERLESAGVEVREYNVDNPVRGGNPLDANTRMHRKLVIVDGEVAFTGGINFSRFYSKESTDKDRTDPLSAGWRDTHIAVRGPAVAGFESIFASDWRAECTDEPCSPLPDILVGDDAGDDVVAVLQGKGGDDAESSIYWAYLEAMRLARERIWITQAYFAPDDRFMELLTEAADRGVDVRLIVPAYSDTNVVVHASRSRYGALLKRGIEIYETTTTVLHAKTAVIDGVWSTVGSSNLDYRSFLHNHEVNAVVFGADFAAQMEAQFEKDIAVARAVTLERWRQRPIGEKVKEFFSWAVEYWL